MSQHFCKLLEESTYELKILSALQQIFFKIILVKLVTINNTHQGDTYFTKHNIKIRYHSKLQERAIKTAAHRTTITGGTTIFSKCLPCLHHRLITVTRIVSHLKTLQDLKGEKNPKPNKTTLPFSHLSSAVLARSGAVRTCIQWL